MPPNFWLDVLKAFIGAALGAGFAFASTLLVQRRQRRAEHIKAGNLAIALLREMIDGYVSVRKSATAMKDAVLKQAPTSPQWCYFKPMSHPYGRDLSFDLTTLSFLFDRHGVQAVHKLAMVETHYRSLGRVMEAHRGVMEEIQRKMSSFGIPGGKAQFSPPEIEPKLGPDVVTKANDLTAALLQHFDSDEPLYRDAYQFLRTELVRRYGNKFIEITWSKDKGASMSAGEIQERQRLYERTRDELHGISKSISENLDKSLLTLSSAFLGGSLAFIKQIVDLDSASGRWLLHASWLAFAVTIALTLASFIYGLLTLETLRKAAERYYMHGEENAQRVSVQIDRRIILFAIACGVSFGLGIVLLGIFVFINT